jgi:hypothetical protein
MSKQPESQTTCLGCKYLYGDGSGYSNYTWMETYVRCAKDKNPELLKDQEEPCDWNKENDNWKPTMNGRCDEFSAGDYITLDPDREIKLSEETKDQEQIEAIFKHAVLDKDNL